jgi:predicted lipid carrier protein YhbT
MVVYRTRLMIDEQSMERALEWMMDNVTNLAQATANRKYIDDYKKVKELELKHLFTIAEAKIEVWRTIQANNRVGVV